MESGRWTGPVEQMSVGEGGCRIGKSKESKLTRVVGTSEIGK